MKNKILGLTILLTVGVLLCGSVLVPIVNDAERVSGPAVTASNNTLDSYFTPAKEGDVIEISDVVKFNGTVVNNATYRNVLYSDGGWVSVSNPADPAGNPSSLVTASGTALIADAGSTVTVTITGSSAVVSMTVGGTATSTPIPFEWAYLLCDAGNPSATHTLNAPSYSPAYITSDTQIVISVFKYTGTITAFISYHDGVLESTAPGATIDLHKTDLDGTTDLYSVAPIISVNDETVDPAPFLVPLTVIGHESGSGAQGILHVIPLLVIVSLIVMATAVIGARRD